MMCLGTDRQGSYSCKKRAAWLITTNCVCTDKSYACAGHLHQVVTTMSERYDSHMGKETVRITPAKG